MIVAAVAAASERPKSERLAIVAAAAAATMRKKTRRLQTPHSTTLRYFEAPLGVVWRAVFTQLVRPLRRHFLWSPLRITFFG